MSWPAGSGEKRAQSVVTLSAGAALLGLAVSSGRKETGAFLAALLLGLGVFAVLNRRFTVRAELYPLVAALVAATVVLVVGGWEAAVIALLLGALASAFSWGLRRAWRGQP